MSEKHIRVLVEAGSKHDEVSALSTHFLVKVKESPAGNQANRKVVGLLATYFNVPTNAVHIVSGHHASRKTIAIKRA